ncbi:MAG: tetratricopeptide repeat protein [Crocosphaera sp.]|nr:tetratricopeptide repeat protein [Crocosphaera sp.]
MIYSANYFFRFLILIAAILFCLGFSSPTSSKLSINSQFAQGISSLNEENYQQAISNFTEVINNKNDLMDAAYSNRCLAHLQLNNNQAAKEDCYQALTLNSKNIEAYLNNGIANYRLDNYQQALAAYEQIIKLKKDDYRAYYNQGLVYFQLADYDRALNSYNQALSHCDENQVQPKILIHYDRALTHLKLENFSKAIADLNHVIIFNPNHEYAYSQRGYAYLKSGNYGAAFKDFSQVIELNPQATFAYINRGITAGNLGFKKVALKDFNIALKQFEANENLDGYQKILALIRQLKQMNANTYRISVG